MGDEVIGSVLHNWATSLFHIFVVVVFLRVCMLLEDIRDELRKR